MLFRTQRWHVPSRNHEPSWGKLRLQEAYTKACPNSAKKIPQHVGAMSCHHAKFHDFQACFVFTGIKRPSFSIFPAQPRCPDVWIHSHLLHRTYKFTQGHTRDFSNNFGALEPVLVVQIWSMHIKCQETQLMYKKAKRARNNSKI